ncbi:MAG: hypothetical protein AAGI46_00175 [Planctomycetota bacterium]
MSVVPRKNVDKIQFFEDHISVWTAQATTIGTTEAEVTDLDTKTQAARTAYDAQQAAQNAAKAATADLNVALDAMSRAGSDIIYQIRSQAGADGDGVYAAAQIPVPATPSPSAAPGTPYELKTEVNGNGELMLSWKCDNPAGTSGTIYQVYRSTNGSLDFEYLGGVGSRKFVDATIPAGATQITYKMQAVRSTAAGMWATFNVLFGSNVQSSATPTASVSEESPSMKMAA